MSKTFIEKVYDNYLNKDYDPYDDNLNPVRDISESTVDTDSEIQRLYNIAEATLREIQEKYSPIDFDELKSQAYNTGNFKSPEQTLEEIFAEMRTGGNGLIEFSDLLDKDLPLEKEIIDTMINLLILQNYYGDPGDEEQQNPTTGGTTPPPGPGPGPTDSDSDGEPTDEDTNPPTNPGGNKDGEPENEGDTTVIGGDPEQIECSECNTSDQNVYGNTQRSATNGNDENNSGDETPKIDETPSLNLNLNLNVGPGPKGGGNRVYTPVEIKKNPKELADCAKYDLQLLKIILNVVKIVKVLMIIVDPIYSIVTQVVEILALVCGCWRNPANIGEIVQRLCQQAFALISNLVTTLLDKLWKMLGMNCITEASVSLIKQIQDALKNVKKVTTALNEVEHKFIGVAAQSYKDSAKVLESLADAKEEFTKRRKNDITNIWKPLIEGEEFKELFDNIMFNGPNNKDSLLGILATGTSKMQMMKDIQSVYKSADSFKNDIADIVDNGFVEAFKDIVQDKHTNWGLKDNESESFTSSSKKWAAEAEKLRLESRDRYIDAMNKGADAKTGGGNFWADLSNAFGLASYEEGNKAEEYSKLYDTVYVPNNKKNNNSNNNSNTTENKEN